MSFQKIPTLPGVYKDDTPTTAEGFFIDANNIRFVRGLAQTRGGYESVSSVAVTGICRGLHSWADSNTVKWLGIGTHTNLYLMTDSLLYDCTPVVSRGHVSISFTTAITSAIVTADWTSHGLVQGQAFSLANSTVATVGGVTINTAVPTTAVPSPFYIVLAVNTANQITFTAAQVASASAGPTAATVDFKQFLAPGLQDSIGALGYSTGVYSTGSSYSSPATGNVFARTWSLSNFGQNLLANPRGGKIYEIAPTTAVTEIVVNGDFSASTPWTGWAASMTWTGGVAAATLSNAALTQPTLSVDAGAYNVISVDVGAWTTGVLTVAFNGSTVITASAGGTFTGTFYGGNAGASASLVLTPAFLTANIDNVSMKRLTTAEVMPNAPTQNTCMVVTPDNFVMVGGTIEVSTGLFNPMHVRWSDAAPNSHTWSAGSTTQAGSWTLGAGSRIVGMKVCNSEILIGTDKATYAGTYTNNPSNPYVFRLVGIGCGWIGPNACAVLGGVAYWMSPQGQYFQYAGGVPVPLQSTMGNDVFSNISFVQQDKIFAASLARFQDVLWLYPDQRDGTNEVSRYALLDTIGGQQNAPVWAPGMTTRTALIDSGVNQYPVSVDVSRLVYYEEKGNTADGGNLSWYLETGSIRIGNGDTLWRATQFVPDFGNLLGGLTMTAYGYAYPQSTPVAHGPFMVTATTQHVDLLADAPSGREIGFLFSGNASPAQARTGTLMMDIEDTGMAF